MNITIREYSLMALALMAVSCTRPTPPAATPSHDVSQSSPPSGVVPPKPEVSPPATPPQVDVAKSTPASTTPPATAPEVPPANRYQKCKPQGDTFRIADRKRGDIETIHDDLTMTLRNKDGTERVGLLGIIWPTDEATRAKAKGFLQRQYDNRRYSNCWVHSDPGNLCTLSGHRLVYMECFMAEDRSGDVCRDLGSVLKMDKLATVDDSIEFQRKKRFQNPKGFLLCTHRRPTPP